LGRRRYLLGSPRASAHPGIRDVAQPGSAPAWGAGGRGFKSRRPDHRESLLKRFGGLSRISRRASQVGRRTFGANHSPTTPPKTLAYLESRRGWYSIVFFAQDRKPSKKRHALKTQDRKTALRLQARLEDAYALGRFDPWSQDPRTFDRPAPTPAPHKMSLRVAINAFYDSRSAARSSTLSAYRDVLEPMCRIIGEGVEASALSSAHLLLWWSSLRCSPASRVSYRARVRTFVRFLMQQGVLGQDPCSVLAPPVVPDKLAAKCMTEDHLAAFVAAVRHRETPYLADFAVVSFDLALRRSEAAALRCGDVDLGRGIVLISSSQAFSTKTGNTVVKPIPPRSMDILRRRCEGRPPEAPVFYTNRGKAIGCVRRLTRTWKACARRAGLPDSITPHSARHGGLSKLVAAGLPVEAARLLAGHTTTAMTMRYVHLQDKAYHDLVLLAHGYSP